MLESWFGGSREHPGTVERSPAAQAAVDELTARLALYHYEACWFCGRVRSAMRELNLNIELRDVHREPEHHQTLIREGGSGTVPCLRIEADDGVRWMYESADIIEYLAERFGLPPATSA